VFAELVEGELPVSRRCDSADCRHVEQFNFDVACQLDQFAVRVDGLQHHRQTSSPGAPSRSARGQQRIEFEGLAR